MTLPERTGDPVQSADAGHHDAIVLGAGMAGLSAAEQLSKAGFRVLVIEARSRIGGRIHTIHAAGWPTPVELGAEFIHGPHAGLESLAREAGAEPEKVPETHWRSDGGTLRSAGDFWGRVTGALQRMGPAFNGTFAEWVRANAAELSADERRDLREFVTGFHAADPDAASARTLFVGAHQDEEQSRIPGGYVQLVTQLHERLVRRGVSIELNTPVDEVRWRPGSVEIISGASARRWRARIVVITLPLGVLQAEPSEPGAVAFHPPLRERAERWRRMGLGHVARVLFRLRDDIWDTSILPAALREDKGRAFGFVHAEGPGFPVWWSLAPEPVLVGWWGGPEARAVQGLSETEIFARARDWLAAAFGLSEAQLDELVVGQTFHNWSRDPYSRGAYSFATAGEEEAPEELSAPVKRTLFFAGEAFSSALLAGTVQGALESGVRAGQAAAAALRPRRRPPSRRGPARGPQEPRRVGGGA